MKKLVLLAALVIMPLNTWADARFENVVKLDAPRFNGLRILARQGTEAKADFNPRDVDRCSVPNDKSGKLIDSRGHAFCKLHLNDARGEELAGDLEWASEPNLFDTLTQGIVQPNATTNAYCLFFSAIQFKNITCGLRISSEN